MGWGLTHCGLVSWRDTSLTRKMRVFMGTWNHDGRPHEDPHLPIREGWRLTHCGLVSWRDTSLIMEDEGLHGDVEHDGDEGKWDGD